MSAALDSSRDSSGWACREGTAGLKRATGMCKGETKGSGGCVESVTLQRAAAEDCEGGRAGAGAETAHSLGFGGCVWARAETRRGGWAHLATGRNKAASMLGLFHLLYPLYLLLFLQVND